ncbi:hypothetical protein T439DRAFT_345227 [Meredithblackwellia eburnea MCA 4105]
MSRKKPSKDLQKGNISSGNNKGSKQKQKQRSPNHSASRSLPPVKAAGFYASDSNSFQLIQREKERKKKKNKHVGRVSDPFPLGSRPFLVQRQAPVRRSLGGAFDLTTVSVGTGAGAVGSGPKSLKSLKGKSKSDLRTDAASPGAGKIGRLPAHQFEGDDDSDDDGVPKGVRGRKLRVDPVEQDGESSSSCSSSFSSSSESSGNQEDEEGAASGDSGSGSSSSDSTSDEDEDDDESPSSDEEESGKLLLKFEKALQGGISHSPHVGRRVPGDGTRAGKKLLRKVQKSSVATMHQREALAAGKHYAACVEKCQHLIVENLGRQAKKSYEKTIDQIEARVETTFANYDKERNKVVDEILRPNQRAAEQLIQKLEEVNKALLENRKATLLELKANRETSYAHQAQLQKECAQAMEAFKREIQEIGKKDKSKKK